MLLLLLLMLLLATAEDASTKTSLHLCVCVFRYIEEEARTHALRKLIQGESWHATHVHASCAYLHTKSTLHVSTKKPPCLTVNIYVARTQYDAPTQRPHAPHVQHVCYSMHTRTHPHTHTHTECRLICAHAVRRGKRWGFPVFLWSVSSLRNSYCVLERAWSFVSRRASCAQRMQPAAEESPLTLEEVCASKISARKVVPLRSESVQRI